MLGSIAKVSVEDVLAEIEAAKEQNPCLIYTYKWSPFSAGALALLDESGYQYTNVELGNEWFTLDGRGSQIRVALSGMCENGATAAYSNARVCGADTEGKQCGSFTVGVNKTAKYSARYEGKVNFNKLTTLQDCATLCALDDVCSSFASTAKTLYAQGKCIHYTRDALSVNQVVLLGNFPTTHTLYIKQC